MKGFTLLEVLVALVIMAMAVTVVLQLFSSSLRTVALSGGMTAAAARGDARFREILSESYLTEQVWSETTEDGYQMDVSISEVQKERTDNLPVRLMEVGLTVRWREGWKEKNLSLKTMKVIEKKTPTEKDST